MEWLEGNQIKVDPPKRPKKITGTRFGAILGLNPWKTPFEVWCEVTRTYEKPFEDTIYTTAGKIIEPKQAAYIKSAYFMRDMESPTDIYGADYFNKTYGDFYKDEKVFGGMWDYISRPDEIVFEMKTTKRAEDWQNDVPEYYALQAALYAYLLGWDKAYMVASFLKDEDYEHPEDFAPTAANTIVEPFSIEDRYPDFQKYIEDAVEWWDKYVVTGISPPYDEKKDSDILKELRKNTLNPTTDIAEIIAKADELQREIDEINSSITEKEKELTTIKAIIKEYGTKMFRPGDKQVVLPGSSYNWTISKSSSTKVNTAALKEDGLYEKYSTTEDSYRLTNKAIGG